MNFFNKMNIEPSNPLSCFFMVLFSTLLSMLYVLLIIPEMDELVNQLIFITLYTLYEVTLIHFLQNETNKVYIAIIVVLKIIMIHIFLMGFMKINIFAEQNFDFFMVLFYRTGSLLSNAGMLVYSFVKLTNDEL